MSGPNAKKRPLLYKPTEGPHSISADGRTAYIGGSKFKRTVLPSVATKHLAADALAEEVAALDEKTFQETESES